MQGATFQGIEQVAAIEMAEPHLDDSRDAIVRVSMAGLCGSDLHPFFGREKGLDPGTVMGHEMVGEVVDVGSDVTALKVGDRVSTAFSTSCGQCFFCTNGLTSRCVEGQLFGWRKDGSGLHGCQSEFVRVPLADGTLVKIPDRVTDEVALLLGDNFCTGYFAAQQAGVSQGGVYAVLGCGTVGLLGVFACILAGAETVVAIDPLPYRRDFAASLGALALSPDDDLEAEVRRLTGGRGADGVLEVVGLQKAQRQAFLLLRPGGTLAVIGCHSSEHFAFSPNDAYEQNLTLRTGRCPARSMMESLVETASAHSSTLERLITHRFKVEDCVDAYDVFAGRKDGCLKAVLAFS